MGHSPFRLGELLVRVHGVSADKAEAHLLDHSLHSIPLPRHVLYSRVIFYHVVEHHIHERFLILRPVFIYVRPVDAHCHLDFEQFDGDRENVIERSKEKLEFVVNAGTKPENNSRVLELSRNYPDFIRPALGLHPTAVDSFDRIEEVRQQVREHDPVAVGEIGLDYHHVTEEEKREDQRAVFREMLQLAEEEKKPVVIHSRNAEKDAVEILEEFELEGVMLHSFNGRPELAERAVELGAKIGVTTQVLYSDRVREIVESIGVENILLETDSPFMYPEGRNEPVNVLESAENIASILETDREDVIRETSETANSFFGET